MTERSINIFVKSSQVSVFINSSKKLQLLKEWMVRINWQLTPSLHIVWLKRTC